VSADPNVQRVHPVTDPLNYALSGDGSCLVLSVSVGQSVPKYFPYTLFYELLYVTYSPVYSILDRYMLNVFDM